MTYDDTVRTVKTQDAVSGVDNGAGADTSAAVDLHGAREFNLEVTYNGDNATDGLVVTLFGSIDGTEFGDGPAVLAEAINTAANLLKFEWTLPGSASEVTRAIHVKDFAFPHVKVKVASAGATTTFGDVTVKLQRSTVRDNPNR